MVILIKVLNYISLNYRYSKPLSQNQFNGPTLEDLRLRDLNNKLSRIKRLRFQSNKSIKTVKKVYTINHQIEKTQTIIEEDTKRHTIQYNEIIQVKYRTTILKLLKKRSKRINNQIILIEYLILSNFLSQCVIYQYMIMKFVLICNRR
ncbi:unnamed protein product [Paramecium pentaurelia]|uniref:Transmembrane protein n=1 Tax=Paramecium pentaurelia TaxID=43138 RepID=A0A8S1VVP8_9CILI|nr:unnamed protein product [Paramecium pentaurelia]